MDALFYLAVVLIFGSVMYYFVKKTLKVTLFLFCIGMVYIALKYIIGVS